MHDDGFNGVSYDDDEDDVLEVVVIMPMMMMMMIIMTALFRSNPSSPLPSCSSSS